MGKETKNKTIGHRLSYLRKKKKISLEELSDKTGLKISHLENIEEGKDFTPVGDILKMSKALTVDPDELFQSGKESEKNLKKKRALDFKKREEAYQYTVLTKEAKNKHLRAFQVSIPAGREHPKINYQHEGEEFVYTLNGEVEIKIGQKKHHLKKGDSLHFNSGVRHSLKNPGKIEAILIVAVYTP